MVRIVRRCAGKGKTPMNSASEILALAGEAAVLVRRGKIAYANDIASGILGESCVGQSIRSVFGKEVAGTQAGSFVAGVTIEGQQYILRMAKIEDEKLIFFSCPETAPALLNDAFLSFLRTALMNMGITADRMRDQAEGAGDEALLSHVASLTRSCYRLNRLVSNTSLILDISRGLLQAGPEELDLSALCQSLMDTVSFFCPDAHFTAELGQNIRCTADASMVSQLLLNLLSNSLLHAKGCTNIRVSITDAGESVILSVSDDGCGIEAGELYRVFDRYRHSFSMSAMAEGTGLGLTAARCIAQLHGGTLLLESRPDRGTSVRASLYRSSPVSTALRAGRAEPPSVLRLVQTGLADVLSEDCFTEKFMD